MKKVLWLVVAIVVGLPVLAVGGLFLAGKRDSAGRNGAAVVIDRPAAVIWPYLTRPEKLKQWLTGLEEITPVSGSVDAPTVGAKSRVKVRGRPNDPVMEVAVEYRLDEKDGKTTVSMYGVSEYQGAIPRLFEPLITASAQDKLESDLRTLKTVVEGESSGWPTEEPSSASAAEDRPPRPPVEEVVEPAAEDLPPLPPVEEVVEPAAEPAAEPSAGAETEPTAPSEETAPAPPEEAAADSEPAVPAEPSAEPVVPAEPVEP